MLLAVALRALRWHGTAVMFNDGPRFLAMAQAFAAGEVSRALAGPDHPLYPALVAPLLAWLGAETAAVSVSVLAGGAAVAAAFCLADAVVGRTAAWCAAALLATHGIAIEFTGDIQSEGVYLALWLGAAALVARALAAPRAGTALAAGACTGLAYLARPEGLLLLAVALALLGWRALRGALAPSRAASLALAIVVGAALLAAPYLVWLRAHDGEWSLTRKKSVATLVGVEAPAPAPRAAAGHGPRRTRAPLPSRLADAGTDLARTLARSLRWEGIALLLAGAAAAWPLRPRREDQWPLALIAAYAALLFALGVSQGYVSTRHALPPAVVALSWVGAAAVAIGRRFFPRRALLATALCIAVAGSLGLAKALRPDRTEERAERILAEWLRESGAPVTGVASAKERIAWYAGAPHVPIRAGMLPGSLRRRGASHVILTDSHVARLRLRRPLETQYREIRTLEAEGTRAHLWEAAPREATAAKKPPPKPR